MKDTSARMLLSLLLSLLLQDFIRLPPPPCASSTRGTPLHHLPLFLLSSFPLAPSIIPTSKCPRYFYVSRCSCRVGLSICLRLSFLLFLSIVLLLFLSFHRLLSTSYPQGVPPLLLHPPRDWRCLMLAGWQCIARAVMRHRVSERAIHGRPAGINHRQSRTTA